MAYDNKIAAIKALREMTCAPRVQLKEDENDPRVVRIVSLGSGLKECKDFVEACMALGQKQMDEKDKEDYDAVCRDRDRYKAVIEWYQRETYRLREKLQIVKQATLNF